MHPENIRKGRRRKRTRNNPLACRFPAYRPDKGKSRAGPVFVQQGNGVLRGAWSVHGMASGSGTARRWMRGRWSSLPVFLSRRPERSRSAGRRDAERHGSRRAGTDGRAGEETALSVARGAFRHGPGERSRPALDAWPAEQPSCSGGRSEAAHRYAETRRDTEAGGPGRMEGPERKRRSLWRVERSGMAPGNGAARRWMRGRWRNRALTGFSFSALLVRGA